MSANAQTRQRLDCRHDENSVLGRCGRGLMNHNRRRLLQWATNCKLALISYCFAHAWVESRMLATAPSRTAVGALITPQPDKYIGLDYTMLNCISACAPSDSDYDQNIVYSLWTLCIKHTSMPSVKMVTV